jgi:hypothetical protein
MKPTFKGGHSDFKVTCQDFSGELFDKLRYGRSQEIDLYLEQCAGAGGLLVILDGTFFTEDQKYAQGLTTLQSELNLRLKEKKLYRIAVVFSKAEQSQVWIHRYDIQKFMRLKFYQTYQILEQWGRQYSINYFFCSAFGTKGDRKPNVKVTSREGGVTAGIIDKPELWQPFGLVAPIYWLYTGQDRPDLREI